MKEDLSRDDLRQRIKEKIVVRQIHDPETRAITVRATLAASADHVLSEKNLVTYRGDPMQLLSAAEEAVTELVAQKFVELLEGPDG